MKTTLRHFTIATCVAASLALHLAAAPPAVADQGAPSLETRMPAGANLYVRAEKAPDIAGALASYRDRIAIDVEDPLAKWMADFKTRTGIDVTDVPSLKKAGIDITKPLAFSRYAVNGGSAYLVLLPVTTGGMFPYSFAKMLQKFGDGTTDLNPAVTRHGKHATFQVRKDIFFAADRDYFLLSSDGALLRKALDLGAAPAASDSLAAGANLSDCAAKLGIAKGILIFSEEGSARKDTTGLLYSGARFNAGADALGGRIVFALNPSSVHTPAILSALKTGEPVRCPHVEAMTFSVHLALDLKALAVQCADPAPGNPACGIVKAGLDLFESYYGLNFSRELLPRAGKTFSFQVRKSAAKGTADSFLLHVSKDAGVTVRDMRRSLFREVERRGGDTKDETMGGTEALRATDDRGRSTIYAVDERGIFIGNNAELIAAGLAAKEKDLAEICGLRPGSAEAGGAFAHARLNLREESVIRTMALLALYGTQRRIYNFINGTDTITLTGTVSGNAVLFDIDARLLPARKTNGR